MDETTLKKFALHYNIRCMGVTNLFLRTKLEMITHSHAIMFGILLITGYRSIFQMLKSGKITKKNSNTVFKINIRFEQLLNYF